MMWFRIKQQFKTYVQTQIFSQGCKSFLFLFLFLINVRFFREQTVVVALLKPAAAGLVVTMHQAFAAAAAQSCTSKSAQHHHHMPFDKQYTELKPTGVRRGFGSCHLWNKAHRWQEPPHLMSGNKVMLLSCCSCCPPGGTRLRKHLPAGLEFSRRRGAQTWSSWASSSKPSSLCCPHSERHQPAADGFTIDLASSSGTL